MKKSGLIIIGLIIVVLGGLVFLYFNRGCVVSFDTNGGTNIDSIKVKKNSKIDLPDDPSKDGYLFNGWYYDGEEFDIDMKIIEDIELEANWVKEEDLVEIPDIKGLDIKDALTILKSDGFTINGEYQFVEVDDMNPNLVFKTEPAIGTKRVKGTEITIYISKEVPVVVEDYTGMNYKEVKAMLETRSINVIVKRSDTDSTKDLILSQDVSPGTKLSSKDSITLYIPSNSFVYPDFSSWTISEVEEFCSENDIVLKIEGASDTVSDVERIVYQSRAAGSTVVPGSTLTIKVMS